MAIFLVEMKLDQIVTKEVTAEIEAEDKDEAVKKLEEALQTYPEPLAGETGIRRIQTTKASYWPPKSLDLVGSKKA